MRNIAVYLSSFGRKTYMASLKDLDDASKDPIVVHGLSTIKEAISSVLEKAEIATFKNTNESWQYPGITYGWMCDEVAEIRFWEELYLTE